ncbi:NUDIX hydrolase [Halomicroarcula sp. GCM10025817]|uniref:NUDIX hydrolase n=1 Tax=Haloarcula TaxID=2237 RepID=UPI0023E8393C|nr:NUDIX domain-containing protein [Halomicroarcula sp. SYNS111]
MVSDGETREDVQDRLERLEQVYGAVTVNQTTYEVDDERYRRVATGSGREGAEVHVVVRNEADDVLVREGERGWTVPRGQIAGEETPEAAAKRIVRENVGVNCVIEDIDSAIITGYCNSDDPSAETVYQLVIVFAADVDEPPSTETDQVRWDAEPSVAGVESVR